MADLSQEEIKEIFWYNPLTGWLHWRKPRRLHLVNKAAGSLEINKCHRTPYIRICYNRGRYYAHRLVWIYFNGAIPNGYEVDHKDRVGTNIFIWNLRLATRRENSLNREMPIRYKTAIKEYRVNQ